MNFIFHDKNISSPLHPRKNYGKDTGLRDEGERWGRFRRKSLISHCDGPEGIEMFPPPKKKTRKKDKKR
jgi:hypothetical protein